MTVENTDLERRVLAHERILQTLIAELSAGNPGIIDAVKEKFVVESRRSYQHDYVETDDYAEQFMVEVQRLIRSLPRRDSQPEPKADQAEPALLAHTTRRPRDLIRTQLRHGVWHVTRNDTFLGDYKAAEPAFDAAIKLARDIERDGGSALVQFGE